MVGFAETANNLGAQFDKLAMAYRENDPVVGVDDGLCDGAYAVFVLCFLAIDPGVVDIDLYVVFAEFANNVYDLGIAQVRAVFLEGQAHDQNTRTIHLQTFFQHGLDQL